MVTFKDKEKEKKVRNKAVMARMTRTEDENNFSQTEWEIEEMNAGIQTVKKGWGAMRKLIAITGKQGVRVQFLLEHMLRFYSNCNHPLFFLPRLLCTFYYTRGKI